MKTAEACRGPFLQASGAVETMTTEGLGEATAAATVSEVGPRTADAREAAAAATMSEVALRTADAREATAPGRSSGRVNAFRELPLVYGAMATYAIASMALMATRQVGITPGHIVLIAIVGLALSVRAHPAVWEWVPFFFLVAMFQDLAAVAGAVSGIVHPAAAMVIEKGLFGGAIATSWLQVHLSRLPGMPLIAAALVLLYLLNDIAPLILGAWLWWRHRALFRPFIAAYVLVMSVGFLIYLLFPEAPPWAAARGAMIPHVDRIVVETLQRLVDGLGNFYAQADPEPNAAMPSIHVAIPTIIACMAIGRRGWSSGLAWLAIAYAAAVFFGVVYLGEHYVADGAAGVVLGASCYAVAQYASALHRHGGPGGIATE